MVAFRLKNYAGRDDWRNIIVVLNSHRQQQSINIPHGHYTVVCYDGRIDEKGLSNFTGNSVTVPCQSALIMHD
jgi:pullulanase